ncbi:MAG: hypothetical protein WBV22_05755, partial [Anaerolineaceae bacterium]
MLSFLNQPGFLGTHASLRSDLSLILIILSAILFTIGWRLAVQKRVSAHQAIQNVAVILNSLVVLLAMVGIFILQYLPAIPGDLNNKSLALTAVHATSGTLGLLYGVYVVLVGNEFLPRKLRFKNFKIFMRISYGLYMLVTMG